jgi:hypothetical protein
MTPTGNVIPPSPRASGAVDADREGTVPVDSANPARVAQRSDHEVHLVRAVIHPIAGRRRDNPVRLCVARELGHDIDGAWWPRADRIANELPGLVGVLTPLLGAITSINVNWPPLQRPPDLNWRGWEHKRQHVMTVSGWEACVNLLIIPYATHSALALMVLRRAADLPINSADRDKPAFVAAGSILFAAQQQCAASNATSTSPT